MAEAYPYIRVWGVLMGSFDYYIRDQQALAAKEAAPANAIYKHRVEEDNVWSTTDDILAANTRARFERECERLGVPSPWAQQSAAF